MKKVFAVILALAMVISLAACGGGNTAPANQNNTNGSNTNNTTPEKPVYNRTVSLKDSWAKEQKKN